MTAETLREDWQAARDGARSHRETDRGRTWTNGRPWLTRTTGRAVDRLAGPRLDGQRSTFTATSDPGALRGRPGWHRRARRSSKRPRRFLDTRAVRLLERDAKTREAQYSTPEMLAVEQRVLTRRSAPRAGRGVATPTATERALARLPHLSDEQETMVRRLTTDGDGVTSSSVRRGLARPPPSPPRGRRGRRADCRCKAVRWRDVPRHQLGRDAGMPSTSIAALLTRRGLERARCSSSTRPA